MTDVVSAPRPVDTRPGVRPSLGSIPSQGHSRPARSGIPDALLVVAAGVLMVALAYSRGRANLGFPGPLYWTGQVLIFSYVAYRVLGRATLPRDREVLVLIYAGAQSIIRWAYSPQGFTFSDELQHLRALENLLATNHLFSPNYSLPISPRYPGLENVTAEFVQVSSLGSFTSGVLITALTHMMAAGCIVLLFREITRSSQIACAAALIYLLNPHASFFNTSFLYETLALPFTVLSLLFAIRFATRRRSRWRCLYALLACVTLVAVTHHVSVVATASLIAIVAVATAFFRRSRNLALPLAFCATAAALVAAVWILGVAPITIEYLGAPIQQFLGSLSSLTQFRGRVDFPAPPTPLFDRLLAPAGVLLTLGIVVANLRHVRDRRPLEQCWSWVALALYLSATGTRVLVTNGAELSGRLLTFAALFSALAVGTVLLRLASTVSAPRRFLPAQRRLMTATAMALVLLLGSITTSLPAWWQRIPGQFWIEGFASGIDAVGTSRAQWAAAYLKPGSRYVGDITSLTLLSTIAQLDPVKDPGSVYYADGLTPEVVAHVKSNSVVYLDVDLRMSEAIPIGGKYFPQDVMSPGITEPIDVANLTKFDDIRGLSRIYDSGYARFYDLRGGQESPYAR